MNYAYLACFADPSGIARHLWVKPDPAVGWYLTITPRKTDNPEHHPSWDRVAVEHWAFQNNSNRALARWVLRQMPTQPTRGE